MWMLETSGEMTPYRAEVGRSYRDTGGEAALVMQEGGGEYHINGVIGDDLIIAPAVEAGGEVGEGLTKQNCKGQSGEGAIFVAALVATILNKVQDNRVTLLHSSQD